MSSDPKERPERAETDSSLKAERHKTDEQLAQRRSATEQAADAVVELARERADEVLEATRRAADVQLVQQSEPAARAEERELVRASEDEVVDEERSSADDVLERERSARKSASALLLLLERAETDGRLLTERAHADGVVASRDEFLAIVSHDVRNILASMAMSSELLLRLPLPGEDGEQTRREAQRIRRLTSRMNGLVGDLIDVVSMESGKLRMEPTEQDATALLTETTESFQLLASSRQIRLVSISPPGPVLAWFDHDRLLQVLANLVGNALKFTEVGGCVTLELESTASGLQFTVRDDGCGIASDQLDTVFERFSQASRGGPSAKLGGVRGFHR